MNASDKIILCDWRPCVAGEGVTIARILDRTVHIEGVDINRYNCDAGGKLSLAPSDGHLFSLLSGSAELSVDSETRPLTITTGTHLYVPPHSNAQFRFSTDATSIHVATDETRSRGTKLIARSERFLAPARFTLTPQYLSRRAFVHRDSTLVSKNGDPVAWFHTTMFDTRGLPANVEGDGVFKMSYDYQSESNIVYNVTGRARVRFAKHPYVAPQEQTWSAWSEIDNDTTYNLNESSNGKEIERHIDPVTNRTRCLRNRHELFIEPGSSVSLLCMFDPGPTGLETHQPGEYSSYGPVADTLLKQEYQDFLTRVAATDDMIDTLSLMQARGQESTLEGTPQWQVYQSSVAEKLKAEAVMISAEAQGREAIVEPWRLRAA